MDGAPIVLPARFDHMEVGASVAMVMRGPGDLAGYVLMTDFSVPHDSYYRPAIKQKCMDGTLAVGGQLLAAGPDVDPATFKVEVRINGELKQTVDFSQLVRPAAQLLADVGEFMTLGTGDVALSPGFLAWREMCAKNPDFDVARLFARGNPQMSAQECAAYNAPFPDKGHRAALRAFPPMVPDATEADGATATGAGGGTTTAAGCAEMPSSAAGCGASRGFPTTPAG